MRVNSTSRRPPDPGERRATAPSPSVLMSGVCCARTPPRRTSSHRRGQVSDPDQVIGGEREREHPVDQRGASMARLPHQAHRFQPTKDLFHSLALPLADLVSGMARGATIDRAPTPRGVLSHVWSHPVLAHARDEVMVSNPLSPPKVHRLPRGMSSIKRSAASLSAVPVAWVAQPPTARPFRFSMTMWPR